MLSAIPVQSVPFPFHNRYAVRKTIIYAKQTDDRDKAKVLPDRSINKSARLLRYPSATACRRACRGSDDAGTPASWRTCVRVADTAPYWERTPPREIAPHKDP